MCLSWGCVWGDPYVIFLSNNVIRTNIITSDKLDILFILGNNAETKISVLFALLIGLWFTYLGWDEQHYCGRKFQENSLYTQQCPSMASFLPMEARQRGGNLLACRQASKWARRGRVGMFESIISQSNTSNGKMYGKRPYVMNL